MKFLWLPPEYPAAGRSFVFVLVVIGLLSWLKSFKITPLGAAQLAACTAIARGDIPYLVLVKQIM